MSVLDAESELIEPLVTLCQAEGLRLFGGGSQKGGSSPRSRA